MRFPTPRITPPHHRGHMWLCLLLISAGKTARKWWFQLIQVCLPATLATRAPRGPPVGSWSGSTETLPKEVISRLRLQGMEGAFWETSQITVIITVLPKVVS